MFLHGVVAHHQLIRHRLIGQALGQQAGYPQLRFGQGLAGARGQGSLFLPAAAGCSARAMVIQW